MTKNEVIKLEKEKEILSKEIEIHTKWFYAVNLENDKLKEIKTEWDSFWSVIEDQKVRIFKLEKDL